MKTIYPTEHEEQVALFEWASYLYNQYPVLKLMFAIPNGGLRNIKTAINLKKEGVTAEAVIRNYNSDYISNLDIDIDKLVGLIDINSLVEKYLSKDEYEPDDPYEGKSQSSGNIGNIDPIDDLFDRS